MKSILGFIFIIFIALSAPACSRKSGCPADTAQSKVDRHGVYKKSKTQSGLLPAKAYKKKKSK